MYTLEKAIIEYLKLSRPAFVSNHPHVPLIFSSAAVALASHLWVDGTGAEPWPGTFYIALVGPPGSMKSAFVRSYVKVFDPNTIKELDRGSPEAVVIDLADKRHGYLRYDELSEIAERLNSYLGPLIPTLNSAYYLENISQKRTKKEKSVYIPAGDYFMHVYFCGTPQDWGIMERFAAGGFVRRTLVIPTEGEPPFFERDHKDPSVRDHIWRLRAKIKQILRVLASFEVEVVLPSYPELGKELKKLSFDIEKKIMIHEYTQKIIAARILGNLITFNINDDMSSLGTIELLKIIERNAAIMGVELTTMHADRERAIIKIIVPEGGEGPSLDKFLPPHYEYLTFKQLVETIKPVTSAPTPELSKNLERIRNWIRSSGKIVVSRTKFVQEIFHSNNINAYESTIEGLVKSKYIRLVDHIHKGRNVQYVVLDPKAKICANCTHFRKKGECPKLGDLMDPKDIMLASPPWKPACEGFELEWEPEPEEVDKNG